MTYNVAVKDSIDFAGVPEALIDNYRWREGYAPYASAKLIYVRGTGLALLMKCREENPKAVYDSFFDPVYRDSALEFFFSLDRIGETEDGLYLNCEMNSKGTALMEFGRRKPDHHRLDSIAEPPKVKAFREGDCWCVCTVFSDELIEKLFGRRLNIGDTFCGNFYKCGDDTDIPHFGMWSPVMTETPNFHRPDYFGTFIIG